ncbi:c-type cytochrome [Brevundimonas sp. NPDC092305]|uniref:c-type cytochrome n=1 Tax=Brevundimonas sp. NPDC092305 TaxID=3363957 RepID=UPI0037FB2C6A
MARTKQTPAAVRAAILATIAITAAGPAACSDKTSQPRTLAGADPDRGLEIIRRTGCAACHAVPGVDWPTGAAAASLDGFGDSPLISGRLPNQPDTLVRFLRDAPSLDPQTAMPPMPLTEPEARDVAAYLYTLR